MQIEPFTYYRSAYKKRAFLVADVADPALHATVQPHEGRVALIEWGKHRSQAKYHNLAAFISLINEGKLEEFTPKL